MIGRHLYDKQPGVASISTNFIRRALKLRGMTIAACAFLAASAGVQTRRIQLDDLSKIVTVSDPQIAPDGESIVCVVSRPNMDKDRADRELVLVDVDP